MDPVVFVLLVVAGVGAGVVGYLTGMASLVSFPAMLAAGLSPVAANVSQTLGLVGIGAGAAARGAPILRLGTRRDLTRQLIVAAVGGAIGAALLLQGGESVFEAVVPWLILLSAVLVLVSPRLRALVPDRVTPTWVHLLGLLGVSVYGGYFGAGAGTLFLAVSLLTSAESFGRAMVLKSVFLAVANLVASVAFVLFGPVDWWAAIALGLGCVVGGRLGVATQERVPEWLIRWAVAVAGVALAVWFVVR